MGNLVRLILEVEEGIQHFFCVNEILDTKTDSLFMLFRAFQRLSTRLCKLL